MVKNRHHIFWCRKDFTKKKYSTILRKSCIVLVETKKHRQLHQNCEKVIVPQEITCCLVAERLKELENDDITPEQLIWKLVELICSLPEPNAIKISQQLISQIPYLQ